MPVVLIPVHFDRDTATRMPSCQRSIVLRPFLTADFMTGLPAVPNTDMLSLDVSIIAPHKALLWFVVVRVGKRLLMLLVLFAGGGEDGEGDPDSGRHLEGAVRPDLQAARHHRMGMMTRRPRSCQHLGLVACKSTPY